MVFYDPPSKPKRKKPFSSKPQVIHKKRGGKPDARRHPPFRKEGAMGGKPQRKWGKFRPAHQRKGKLSRGLLEHLAKEFVYMERESPFVMPQFIKLSSSVAVAKIKYVQRILGMANGRLQAFDPETLRGEIEIEGHRYPILDEQKKAGRVKWTDLSKLVGKEISFSFWPSLDTPPPENPEGSEKEPLPVIKLFSMRTKTTLNGYVEAIGKLSRCWPGGFEVTLFSRPRKQNYRVVFTGDYPYPDEVGEYVWITGRFEPEKGTIRYEEAEALAFLDKEDAPKLLDTIKKKKAARKKAEMKKKAPSADGEGAVSLETTP
ncbi:MAG: hypothetical protein D6812_12420 [Deltaproteobacteria bacterium]|nr:MAG: hypothetical protein D6812_12420 [Deltaproteobacteria bacterium]